ncbi:hypothetical protein BX661DRAFT_172239 [Kickxella alabastrina]|uniref:uncharacterized protein n=1 Tax=Kickxella alabastrina TaxID=61397 RepID=UPI00221FCD76|nr:uncharacterized protein BX661DRAFT_172239 [Kickxella alabastrina]KAI7825046.1 hypothetical protein BX661DRAFT_172239 [Kickxella alabastrina]
MIIATLIIAASAVLAQEIASTSGPTVSSGSTAISSPNVNNGYQIQNSISNSGSSGGNTYSGIQGSVFNTGYSNSASVGNNFINPAQTSIQGNIGSTVSGQGNIFGSAFGTGIIPPFFAGAFPRDAHSNYHKRDLIINGAAPYAHPGHPAHPYYGYPGYAYGYYVYY